MQVQIGVAGHRLVDRAASVRDADVLAGQRRRRGGAAGRAVEQPRRGRRLSGGADDVREWHRVVALLAAFGADLIVGERIDPSLGARVLVFVLEGDDRSRVGVDQGDPGPGLAGDTKGDPPDQGRRVAGADGPRVGAGGGRRLPCRRTQRNELEPRLLECVDGVGAGQTHVGRNALQGFCGLDVGERVGVDAAPARRSERDQLTVADVEEVALTVDRDAGDHTVEDDLPRLGEERAGGLAVEHELRVVRQDQRPVSRDELPERGRERVDRRVRSHGPGDPLALGQ